MNPDQGRLQTGEHILAKLIEQKFEDASVVIARFSGEQGVVEFNSSSDFREMDIKQLEEEVNKIISQNLQVKTYILPREQADVINIDKIPKSVQEVRVVEIQGFDRRACKDPHVSNTSEIGKLIVDKVKRVGKDRYRFLLRVE